MRLGKIKQKTILLPYDKTGWLDWKIFAFRSGYRSVQPRPQSSSAISDVTSPVKLVGKIRLGRLANNGKSKMAYLPGFMGKKRPPHFVAIR